MRDNYDVHTVNDISEIHSDVVYTKQRTFHVTVLAKNQAGLKQLFHLISLAHTDFFHGSPQIS